MKKIILISLIFVSITIFVCLLLANFKFVDPTRFYDITISYGNKNIIVYEFDGKLKEWLKGIAVVDSPSCPFGSVAINFTKHNNILTLYPADDSCDIVMYKLDGKKYYYNIGKENAQKLKELLIRYGIKYPHSI